MNYNTELVTLASGMMHDSEQRFVCPACRGGTNRESSLSIQRNVLTCVARCWRGTCSLGTVFFNADASTLQRTPVDRADKYRRPTRYPGNYRQLSAVELVQLSTAWGIPCDLWDIRQTPKGDIVIPMLNAHGTRVGDIIRQRKPYDTSRPKSVKYMDEGYSGLAWFSSVPLQSYRICLVEDPISAMRLAVSGLVGVALLGVNLSPSMLSDIVAVNGRGGTIHLALDADAAVVAVRHTRRYCSRYDIRTHIIYHDVKDMDSDEYGNFLRVLGV